jgi:hypothetical protein
MSRLRRSLPNRRFSETFSVEAMGMELLDLGTEKPKYTFISTSKGGNGAVAALIDTYVHKRQEFPDKHFLPVIDLAAGHYPHPDRPCRRAVVRDHGLDACHAAGPGRCADRRQAGDRAEAGCRLRVDEDGPHRAKAEVEAEAGRHQGRRHGLLVPVLAANGAGGGVRVGRRHQPSAAN